MTTLALAELTDEQFINGMREAVRQRGEDWTYPGVDLPEEERDENWWVGHGLNCRYITLDEECPACIVGLALHICGIDLTILGTRGAHTELSGSKVSPKVRQAAQAAQGMQDNGDTWGEALETFECHIHDIRFL